MDPVTYVDRFIGWQAAVEARILASGLLSLEELDNHESFVRPSPSFVWQDADTQVAPEQGAWWHDAQDKGLLDPDLVGWEAVDARLDSQPRETRIRFSMKQWATDRVSRAFFQARTQGDLDEAFALLSSVTERYRLAQGVIELAAQRVVRLERKARQEELDQLRDLNRRMGEWARSVSYRVRLVEEQEPIARSIRDQSWVLVEMRPGIGAVCRGKDVRGRPVVMAEPEIFRFMEARTA